uniref:transposase n=1 Tax=Facilibium subflavum TaxID=2219058 RepID=UPI0013C32BE0|nr:transposase [Facilibium subflavum]
MAGSLTQGLIGKLIGDKGYTLSEALLARGLQLVTRVKKKMKKGLIFLLDKVLLRKKAIIESMNDQLKNISQISALTPNTFDRSRMR